MTTPVGHWLSGRVRRRRFLYQQEMCLFVPGFGGSSLTCMSGQTLTWVETSSGGIDVILHLHGTVSGYGHAIPQTQRNVLGRLRHLETHEVSGRCSAGAELPWQPKGETLEGAAQWWTGFLMSVRRESTHMALPDMMHGF
ncbi:hypothetical protein SVAN01_06415 [Stagonosporopsis vannaccii]|nr:hypothetical protein SVAN01_06415 [Stagonosporopsis vannaccii]